MSSPRSRSITPLQLVALLLAFLCVAGLTGVLAAGLMVPLAGSAGVVAKTVPSVFEDLPADLQIVEPAEESVMLDSSGNVIARFYDKRRIVVPSDKIADVMKQAIVGIEDKRFYQHHGVDPEGMARALVNNLSDDGGTQGASTITQQYVRNMLLEKGQQEGDPDQVMAATAPTTERKLRESKYAMALETQMSKDQILTGYLNIAPFGPTTYGVEAASRLYFSKSANELTMSEAILLAGLVQSPVEYDPLTHPEAAQKRRDTVADVLLSEGTITQQDHDEIVATTVESMLKPDQKPQGCSGAGDMAYFCEHAISDFLADETYGETDTDRQRLLDSGGLTIHTTIDKGKQDAAVSTLANANPTSSTSGVVNGVITSVEPGTGKILSMAQNTAYDTDSGNGTQTMYNFAADGTFQVGSTFKIFTLMEWFKEGHGAYETVGRANRSYAQSEFTCSNGHQVIYTPNPYYFDDIDKSSKSGPMNVIRATGLSVNQAFVNMSSKLDFCNIFETAKTMGITQADGSAIEAIPTNIIGSGSSSPLKMASVAAALANNGVQCAPQSLTKVTDRDENVLKEYQPSCTKVLDETVAKQVSTLLTRSVQQYYNAEGITLADGRQFAAKTGTTDDNSNTWTLGFTPQLATAAWMGNGSASSTSISDVTVGGQYFSVPYGSTVGEKIWAPYMSAALAGSEVVPMPDVFIGNQVVASPRPTVSPNQQGQQGQQDQQGQPEGGQGDDD
ncbi:MAG: penicillin-binding protein [Actinomyces sp.]|nr:penicillin-binding protein [Actinomyces sp.]